MSALPDLSPDATPSEYTIVFSETLAPYLRMLFAQKGLENETIEEYIVRALVVYGKQYLAQQMSISINQGVRQNIQTQIQEVLAQIDNIK